MRGARDCIVCIGLGLLGPGVHDGRGIDMEQVKWMKRFRRFQDEVYGRGLYTVASVEVQINPECEFEILYFRFFWWTSAGDCQMKIFDIKNVEEEPTDSQWWSFVNECRTIMDTL